MKPHHSYTNGDESGGSGGGCGSDSGSEAEEEGAAEELSLRDAGAPARALAALNALRKSRQHYDVLLVAGGAEVPAHRAVLAAASPYLLEALSAPAATPAAHYRVEDVDAAALRALVEYAYTGTLTVRDAAAARALYRAAWRLRVEAARAHLADALLRRLHPAAALEVRALPDLAPHHLVALDNYIAANFDEVCKSGALATLPEIRIEMMRDSSSEGGEEAPLAVADAALAWLRDQPHRDIEELCARTHLVYVDVRGELRDCGELPAARGDAPELQQYRRDTAARRARGVIAPAVAPRPLPGLELGARAARAECGVLAARRATNGGTRALVALRGRLAATRVLWSDVAAGGGGVARGGALGGEAGGEGERRARLAEGRCALGAAALGGRLVVCGGYDRARVLRSAEAYCPASNAWSPLPDMRCARARFPAARLGDTVWALGGSDGHAELDTVDAYEDGGGWRARTRLPLPLSHAAAAADEEAGVLYVVGGWAAGTNLKRVMRYSPAENAWSEAPSLNTGRSQCAGVVWEGALWALGGCDAWHCLASTERLTLRGAGAGAGWSAGPALPTARRSVGGCVWRGRLVSAGGSDGAASLRRTEWLAPGGGGAAGWVAGPALRRARAALGLAVLGDALYAVGGFDGKEFLSCLECLYEPDGEWTALCDPPRPSRSPRRLPLAVPHSPELKENGAQENGPVMLERKENGPELQELKENGPELQERKENGPEVHERKENGPELQERKGKGPELQERKEKGPEAKISLLERKENGVQAEIVKQ